MTEPNLSPQELFDRGIMTPERYWACLMPKDRELVRWCLENHPGLTVAQALDLFVVKDRGPETFLRFGRRNATGLLRVPDYDKKT